jgi:hypothetical protein
MKLPDILRSEIEQLEKEYNRALDKSAAYAGSGEDGFTDADTEQAAIERDRIGEQLKAKRKELKKLDDDDPYAGYVGISKA